MENDIYAEEKAKMAPDEGFDLVGIDYFAVSGDRLYKIEHFDMYQDALTAKKRRKNPEEYFVIYRDAQGRCCSN